MRSFSQTVLVVHRGIHKLLGEIKIQLLEQREVCTYSSSCADMKYVIRVIIKHSDDRRPLSIEAIGSLPRRKEENDERLLISDHRPRLLFTMLDIPQLMYSIPKGNSPALVN